MILICSLTNSRFWDFLDPGSGVITTKTLRRDILYKWLGSTKPRFSRKSEKKNHIIYLIQCVELILILDLYKKCGGFFQTLQKIFKNQKYFFLQNGYSDTKFPKCKIFFKMFGFHHWALKNVKKKILNKFLS